MADRQLERVADQVRASGAVVVVGAGLSWPAGIPLTAQLPPLLWQALDEHPAARADVATALGEADRPAKLLVGDRERAVAAAYNALRRYDGARWSFQRAFAARDRSVSFQSPAHDGLARLFHRGVAEVVVSFNWDTLFERCYARLYGRHLLLDRLYWKPHGDAAQPDRRWVLPGDPGQVPRGLVDHVNSLVAERPRLLLLIGYSESDEIVAQQLTRPLADRWSICRVGPTAAGDLALRLSAEVALLEFAARLVPQPEAPGWEWIIPGEDRGLGPALRGQPLGLADARACPRLPEVTQVVAQLKSGHSARIVGPAGSGKSLCAYQSLLELSSSGYEIVRPRDSVQEGTELGLVGQRFPLVALVDDSHLAPPAALRRLEEAANQRLCFLFVATDQDDVAVDRGSVRIDPKRAVRTIANELRSKPEWTLEAVRSADDRVGDGWLDERLEDRITEAERTAELPWHFCFVLGGGWRQAGRAADAARAEGADLMLAAAAVRQLASRDAPASAGDIAALTAAAGVSTEELEAAGRWLIRERLVRSERDFRCPHQRLAAILLDRIFEGLTIGRRNQFFDICRTALADEQMPFLGTRSLLHTLRFADSLRLLRDELLDASVEAALLTRCFAAVNPEQRMAAALVLTDLRGFVEGWPRSILADRVPVLAGWLSSPQHPSASGLAYLLNDVFNDDKQFAEEMCDHVDIVALARAVADVAPKESWGLGELLDRLQIASSRRWRTVFLEAIDREVLFAKAEHWPADDSEALVYLASGVGAFDEGIGLAMLERAEPLLRSRFSSSPLEAFQELDRALFRFLRVWDPLDVFIGKLRPSAKARAFARRLALAIDPVLLGRAISTAPRARLEPYARLLGFLARTVPRHFKRVVESVDLALLEPRFERSWGKLPHEFVTILRQLRLGSDHEPAASWILSHAERIHTLETSLAVMSPEAAIVVLDHGGGVALEGAMTFDWLAIAYVAEFIADARPDLIEPLLRPHEAEFAKALGRNQANTYEHVDAVLSVLAERAPQVLSHILDQVDPHAALAAWTACLEGDASARRSAARLIELSLVRPGALGGVAQRLRARFPKASLPEPRLSCEITLTSARRRVRRRPRGR